MIQALLLAGALAAPPPLVELRKITFETPYAPNLSYGPPPQIVASSRAPVAYALSYDSLFVVRTTDGAVLDIVDINALAGPYIGSVRLAISEGGPNPRLLLWIDGNVTSELVKQLHSLLITDPEHPVFERRFDMSGRILSVTPLPDGRSVLVVNDVNNRRRADLLDLDLGYGTFSFTPRSHQLGEMAPVAVGGTPERSVFGIYDTFSFYPNTYRALTLFEATSGGGVSEIASFDPGVSIDSMLLDEAGEIAVLGIRGANAQVQYQVRSLPGAELAATVETAGHGTLAILAEGGGGRTLVTLDSTGVDLVDLADPAAPAVVGRVAAGIGFPGSPLSATGSLTASRNAPVVLAAAAGDRSALLIDTGTASVLSNVDVGPAVPVAVRAREGQGAREMVVLGDRQLGNAFALSGGTAELTFVDVSSPTSPSKTGRLLRNQPRTVQSSATLGGRYVVAVDYGSNSLALVRAADGRVLDVTGILGPTPTSVLRRSNPFVQSSAIRTGGPFMLLFSDAESWTEFDVQGDRFRTVRTGRSDGRVIDAAVRADGAVVLYRFSETGAVLEVVPLEGVSGQVPVHYSYYYEAGFSLSSDGTLAAALGGFCDVVDITDAASPRLLWSSHEPVINAEFTGGSSALFATIENFPFEFHTQIHDARSGAMEGSPSVPVEEFFFHGIGAVSETAGISRAVVWTWTYAGFKTAVFDTGSPTPQLLTITPEYSAISEFAPRPGGGWYETHSSDLAASNEILIGEPGGSQVSFPTLGSAPEQPRNLRRGFFITVARDVDGNFLPDHFSLWRDTALNRAPVARAGSDRAVECAGRAGTPVELDGSASSDPDSTPETEDDIASYAWSVDGGLAVDGPAATVPLALGAHAASLTVADVLGAESSDDLAIQVADTLPPDIGLRLEAIFADGRWSNRWVPRGSASDRCDGDLGAPAERLRLPNGAASAIVSFSRTLTASIELRRRRDGALEAKLAGPDEAALRAAWASALSAGGFALTDGGEIGLALAPAAKVAGADLLARYELTAAGRLASANAYGADQDLVVTGSAADGSGHGADTSVSLRVTRAGLTPP